MLQSIFGLIAFLAVAWLLSENRRSPGLPRVMLVGLGLQLVIGGLLLKVSALQGIFFALNDVVVALDAAATAGTSVVFGYLGGAPLPFEETTAGSTFVLAFRGLPIILVMSALSSLLFYWRVLPWVVRGFSWALQRTMKLGGAEGVGVSANIFVGMVEAPLLVRPYLKSMTRSEIFSLMTVGMATIAGTVMVLYATILGDVIPNALGHILTASLISAPAAITVAKVMIPEREAVTSGEATPPDEASSSMDAITRGTIAGTQLLISVIAMIIVLVALVHLVNVLLGLLPAWGGSDVTLQRILGYVMAPVVWLMGVPAGESLTAGSLMGTKTVLNELLAYLDLAALDPGAMSERGRIIIMYAMCGFANPGSLGIMIGGLTAMAPGRRTEIVSLGLRSVLAGTIATCMTGAVAGIFLG
jgi:CNT family concentrative nucleoside transporter